MAITLDQLYRQQHHGIEPSDDQEVVVPPTEWEGKYNDLKKIHDDLSSKHKELENLWSGYTVQIRSQLERIDELEGIEAKSHEELKNKSSEILELKEQIESLQRNGNRPEHINRKTEEELRLEFKKQKEDLESQLQLANLDNQQLQEKLSSKKPEQEGASSKLEEAIAEIHRLKELIAANKSESEKVIQEKEEKIEDLKSSKKEIEKKNLEDRQTINGLKTRIQDEEKLSEKTKRELKNTTDQLSQWTSKAARLENKLKEFKHLEDIESERDKYKEDASLNKEQLEKLEKLVTNLSTRVGQLKQNNNNLKSLLDTQETLRKEAETKRDEIGEQYDLAVNRITELEEELNFNNEDQTIEDLQAQIREKDQEISALNKSIESNEMERLAAEKERNKAIEDRFLLENQISPKNDKIKDLEDKIAGKTDEIGRLQQDLEDKNRTIDQLTQDADNLQTQNTQLQQEIEQSQNQQTVQKFTGKAQDFLTILKGLQLKDSFNRVIAPQDAEDISLAWVDYCQEHTAEKNKSIKDFISSLHFQSKQHGITREANALLLEANSDHEESLRASLFDKDCILSDDYCLTPNFIGLYNQCRSEEAYSFSHDNIGLRKRLEEILEIDPNLINRSGESLLNYLAYGDNAFDIVHHSSITLNKVRADQIISANLPIFKSNKELIEDIKENIGWEPDWGKSNVSLPRKIITLAMVEKWWNNTVPQHEKDYYTLSGSRMKLMFHPGQEFEPNLIMDTNKNESKQYWFKLLLYANLRSLNCHETSIYNFFSQELNHLNSGIWADTPDFDKLSDFADARANRNGYRNLWRATLGFVKTAHESVYEFDFPEVLLEVIDQQPEQIHNFLKNGQLAGQSRWENVPLNKIGAPIFFLLREFKRLENEIPLFQNLDKRDCFYTCRPVRVAMEKIGWITSTEANNGSFYNLQKCSDILSQKVQGSSVFEDFLDIPLLHLQSTKSYNQL